MDALELLKERNRMYESGAATPGIGLENDYDPVIAVKAVEEWSAAHPRKTRQSVFLEQFPNAPIYTNTHNVALDPCLVDTTLRGHCPTGRGCDVCRREFWMQEVE